MRRPNRAWQRGEHRNRGGATAAEFAIAAIPLLFLVFATIEAAWQLATAMALDHAALRASRFGITGADSPPPLLAEGQENVPRCRSESIGWLVTRTTGGMLRPTRLTVETTTWSGISQAERGEGTPGAGRGGQIVSYRLRYRQPFVTGLVAAQLWGGDAFTHEAFLVVKNEPFEHDTC